MAPLLTGIWTAPAAVPVAAVATLAASVAAGRATATALARSEAVVAAPWSPSRRLRAGCGAAIRITGWPSRTPRGWKASGVIVACGDSARGDAAAAPRARDGVLLQGQGPPPRLWQVVAGHLDTTVPPGPAVPRGFSPLAYARTRGLVWHGRFEPDTTACARGGILDDAASRVLTPVRDHILERLSQLLPTREAVIMGAVLLGERDPLDRELREPFTQLGLSHLFSVSGLHVGLIAALVLTLLRPMAVGPLGRCLWIGVVLPVYAVLTGLAGSAVRAMGLGLLAVAGVASGRDHDALRSLGLLFWLAIVWQPDSLGDPGLRLSYLAAGGLMGALRLANGLAGAPRAVRSVVGPLLVSIGATWATLPETAAAFGWIHPFASLVNLVAVPAFAGAVWVAVVALLATPLPWLAQSAAALAWMTVRLLSAGATALLAQGDARLGLPGWTPLSVLPFAFGTLLLVVALRSRPPPWVRCAAAAGAVLCAAALTLTGRTAPSGTMTVLQADIGQGDAAVFVFPDRSAVLVDTGPCWSGGSQFGRALEPWLRREGVRRLASVVLTHGHDDHDGGAAEIAVGWETAAWALGGEAAPPPGASTAVCPAPGSIIHAAGGWDLCCLGAVPAGMAAANENDRSVVLALRRDGATMGLWTGDLEVTGEAALLADDRWWPEGEIDVLKAGHHGSRTSSGQALLDALRPRLVLISCGVENTYEHPSHGPFVSRGDTLPILRTDLCGSVLLRWRGKAPLEVRTTRRELPSAWLDTGKGAAYHARVAPTARLDRPPATAQPNRESHVQPAQHVRSRLEARSPREGARDFRSRTGTVHRRDRSDLRLRCRHGPDRAWSRCCIVSHDNGLDGFLQRNS